MNLTGGLAELQKVFEAVWRRKELHREHQGENVFLVRKDDGTFYFMFSNKKLVRVDHHLSDDEYQMVMEVWSGLDKVIPFAPPQPCEGGTKEVEDAKEVVTVKTLQKALEKQRVEMRSEMLEGLRQTQLEMMNRQREINQQLMKGLVSNLGQMLQDKLGGVIRPSIEGPTITEMKELPAETDTSVERETDYEVKHTT